MVEEFLEENKDYLFEHIRQLVMSRCKYDGTFKDEFQIQFEDEIISQLINFITQHFNLNSEEILAIVDKELVINIFGPEFLIY